MKTPRRTSSPLRRFLLILALSLLPLGFHAHGDETATLETTGSASAAGISGEPLPAELKEAEVINNVTELKGVRGGSLLKNGGRLAAQFWITTDEQIFTNWNKQGALKTLKPVEKVRRNIPIYLAVFLTNPAVEGGRSLVTFDLVVLRPDRKPALTARNRTAWNGASPAAGLVYIARDRGQLSFEQIDPSGTYEVVVVLRDQISKATLTLTRTLVLED